MIRLIYSFSELQTHASLDMDVTENSTDSSDRQQRSEALSEKVERSFEEDGHLNHYACVETPTEMAKTSPESISYDETGHHSIDRSRGYHIKPPNQLIKQGPSGYFISKVTSESKTTQPPPSRGIGKVFVLPKQPVPRPVYVNDRFSPQNQPMIRASAQTAGVMPFVPQTVNRFILKPFPIATSKHITKNNVTKEYKNCQDNLQTTKRPDTRTKDSEICCSETTSLEFAHTAQNEHLPVNSPYQDNKMNLEAHSVSNTHQNRYQSKNVSPQYYRDIRQSFSSSIENKASEILGDAITYNVTHSSQDPGVDISADICASKEDASIIADETVSKSNFASADQTDQKAYVSDDHLKQPECGTTSRGNAASPSKSKDVTETKTPVKKKRSRKPRVYFSPSGNHIPETSENGRVSKGPRKRKLAENTLDKQYFGALKRTFAKRTKPLPPNTGLDLTEEISPNDIETITSRQCQDSDYRLKQKAILTAGSAGASSEQFRSNPLLEKLDPNDIERHQSLAIFSKRYQIQNSNPVQSYKLSFAGSLGQVHRKEADELSRMGTEGKDITSRRAFQTSPSDNKEILSSENCEGLNVQNDSNEESKVEDEGSSLSISTDAKKCYEANEHKALCSNSDLESAKSIALTLPTVVLQRMTGITPSETVQVSRILKHTTFNALLENKESKQEVGDKQDKPNAVLTDASRKVNGQSNPVENEMEKCNIDQFESKKDKNSKATDKVLQKDKVEKVNKQKRTEIMRDEELLHKLLFSDEHLTCSNINEESSMNKDPNSGFKPELSQSSGQCKPTSHNSNKTVSTSLASLSNLNVSQTMYLAQPIPVFYSTNGRLVPGPMPTISDTYQYKLTNGSAVDTTMPATSNLQSGVSPSHLSKDTDNGIAGSSKDSLKVRRNMDFPVKDPTGILTPVSNIKETNEKVESLNTKRKEPSEKIESVGTKSKTVAELLREKRSDKCKGKGLICLPELEFISPVSTFLRRDTNIPNRDENRVASNESTREDNQNNIMMIADKDNLGKNSATKLSDKTGAASKPFSGSPGKPVSDHLYSSPSWNKQMPFKSPIRSASYSPLSAIAGMEHRYSRSLSSLEAPRTLSSESTKPISLIGNNGSKNVPTSPHAPLKIVLPAPKSSLPSPKSQSASMSSTTTTNIPVTVQTFQGVTTQSEHYDPAISNAKPTEATRDTTTHHSGMQAQANQSFAVRIGDKMYIIRPALQVESPKVTSTETLKLDDSIPTSKPETKSTPKATKSTKTSKKRKSATANLEKQSKPGQSPTHEKVMKKKIKKLLKKDKTQFEELIQSLGLEHNKDKKKKPRRKPSHKITYSCTPSPAQSSHDTRESHSHVKEEAITPDTRNASGTDTNSPIKGTSSSKQRSKATKVMEKKAVILQIFKSSNQGSKFFMHTAKVLFTTGQGGDYHRWYNHSDYPCTLHLRNYDTIHQIDAESLRSGFYLISEMDKNILKSRLDESSSVTAVLSLYPPDMNILPEESMAIAVGKINDVEESEQPIPSENENDTVNKNVENIIRSILKLDTFNDIEQIEDERYGSVKDVTMSPKCHSSKFYTPEMFECFTQNRRSDMKGSPAVKISSIDSNPKSVSAKSSFEDIEESDVTVSTKAHELKLKQNELYQECSKLRETIHTGTGLFQAAGLACNLDTLDELSTTSSREDDLPSVSQDSLEFNGGETRNDASGRQPTESNDTDFEPEDNLKAAEDQSSTSGFDKNVNCCVQKKRRSRRAGWSRRPRVVKKTETEFKRCTRSFKL